MAVLKTLTIAGSDTSGGAGLQADLKTFEEYKTYGLSAITCIVTMDPDHNWKHNVTPIAPELVEAQLKTILSGEPIQAMKTGMLGSVEIIKIAANAIKTHQLKNVVIDPVMICKGDDEVLQPDSAQAIRELLIPLATVTTPNLFEAGQLSGLGTPKNLEEMKTAAKAIFELGVPHVVIKGGKALAGEKAIDLYYDGTEFHLLEAEKDANNHNHGAGCTFAAAITGGLANGLSVKEAIYKAKDFVTAAIQGGFAFNQFIGPVWHGAYNQK
ncbi:bifunctional hydroxymethylpyrimidine kinase/phosphomethylpyrimidine kinase [Rhizosphaericola mali]|uniref:pyridoxal kinase n=1 Tax=Rhizosphaericola mali TaxID=2545455 RepID=A0A5P2G228_9BACT|nr:bifunctional hydroxymethylpyrimidine kinase/phosphomethylpyrimidine kinase [Rhizosphaericola mali]QES89866.1 bifunctional hydroxymethylpyrimidine kinase/phosphomethylpyrimidine kinase [Rhizosphaericola mali]